MENKPRSSALYLTIFALIIVAVVFCLSIFILSPNNIGKDNQNFTTIWTKKYSFDGFYSYDNIFQTLDGGYVISGVSYVDNNGYIALLKIDEEGKEIWNSTLVYPDMELQRALDIDQTYDAGFISLYHLVINHSEDITQTELYKIDANGNMEWNISYPDFDSNLSFFMIDSTSDGGFIISGIKYYDRYDYDLVLVKFDEHGNEEWNGTYLRGYFSSDIFILDVTDGYVIGGISIRLEDPYVRDLWLIKVGNNGTESWNITYNPKENFNSLNSLEQSIDGGYFVLKTSGDESRIESAELIKISSEGDILWNKTYEDEYYLGFLSLQKLENDSYLISGSKFNISKEFLWIMKIDESGLVDWEIFEEDLDDYIIQINKNEFLLIQTRCISNGFNLSKLQLK